MSIGDRILAARVRANLSQSDLMGTTGFSRQSISQWENGHAVPSSTSLVDLSSALDVSVDYLLGLTDVETIQGVTR